MSLPDDIGLLMRLKTLIADSNKIAILPHRLYYLQDLEILSLRDNDISQISSKILSLSNLTQLLISQNRIKRLPFEVGYLPYLQVLHLHKNQLSEIPSSIEELE